MDALEEALSYFARVRTRARSWEQLRRQAKVHLDRPSAMILGLLCHNKLSGCKLGDLASIVDVEAPSVTRTVDRLERASLVKRTEDPLDHRAQRLIPTTRGVYVAERLRRAKRERLRSILTAWSAEDRKQLVRLLRRLADDAAQYTTVH